MMNDRRMFEEGDEVVVCTSGWSHSIVQRTKIKKVYKNGNFLLDESQQQWKQNGHQAGESRWSRNYLLHADSPVVAEIEAEANKRKLLNQFIALADKIVRHIRKHEPDPTQLRVARRALLNLLPKEEKK